VGAVPTTGSIPAQACRPCMAPARAAPARTRPPASAPVAARCPTGPLADPINRFEAPLCDPRCHQRRPPPRSRADRLACQSGVHRRGVHAHGRALQTVRRALQTGRPARRRDHAHRRDSVQIALSCRTQRPGLWRLWSHRQTRLRTVRTTPPSVSLECIHLSVHPGRVQCIGCCQPLDAWLVNGDLIPTLLQQLHSLANSAGAGTGTFDNDTVSFKVFGQLFFLLLL
jgi:hypothetical protein